MFGFECFDEQDLAFLFCNSAKKYREQAFFEILRKINAAVIFVTAVNSVIFNMKGKGIKTSVQLKKLDTLDVLIPDFNRSNRWKLFFTTKNILKKDIGL